MSYEARHAEAARDSRFNELKNRTVNRTALSAGLDVAVINAIAPSHRSEVLG